MNMLYHCRNTCLWSAHISKCRIWSLIPNLVTIWKAIADIWISHFLKRDDLIPFSQEETFHWV